MIEVKEENGYKFIPCGDGSLAQGIIEIDNPDKILSPFVQYCVNEVELMEMYSNVLLLGGGTYSIPKAIKLHMLLDIVEIDPYMFKLAKEEFGYKPRHFHNTYIGDADLYINAITDKKYDLVIVDLFSGDSVPNFAKEGDFFNRLARITNRVIVNEISAGLEDPKFDYGKLWEIEEYDLGGEQLWWKIVVLDKIK